MKTYLTTHHIGNCSAAIVAYAIIKAENYDQALTEALRIRNEHSPASSVNTRLYCDGLGPLPAVADAVSQACESDALYLGIFTADDAGKVEIVVSRQSSIDAADDLRVLREILNRHGYNIHYMEKK